MMAFPLPVTILTGFLGAGKTTLLNRLLKNPQLAGTLVLVNEFGEIGIDHLLIEGADDTIIELSNGCLCCTIQGDLVDRLNDIIIKITNSVLKDISHLIIETTGLADPLPILQLFITHPLLLQAFNLKGVITVIDGVNGSKTLENYASARRQVYLADQIIISKTDMLKPSVATIEQDASSQLDDVLMHIKQLNTQVAITISPLEQNLDVSLLHNQFHHRFSDHKHDPDNAHESHHHHHHHHKNRHGDAIHSLCIEYDKPLSIAQIEVFFEQLRVRYGDKILRLKGIVETYEYPDKPLIVHGAQGLFHPPQWLPDWKVPDSEIESCHKHRRKEQDAKTVSHGSQMVIIADGVSSSDIHELFASITCQIGIDRADFQILDHNPLAIPGLRI